MAAVSARMVIFDIDHGVITVGDLGRYGGYSWLVDQICYKMCVLEEDMAATRAMLGAYGSLMDDLPSVWMWYNHGQVFNWLYYSAKRRAVGGGDRAAVVTAKDALLALESWMSARSGLPKEIIARTVNGEDSGVRAHRRRRVKK